MICEKVRWLISISLDLKKMKQRKMQMSKELQF